MSLNEKDKELRELRMRHAILRRAVLGYKGATLGLEQIRKVAVEINDKTEKQMQDIHLRLFKLAYKEL